MATNDRPSTSRSSTGSAKPHISEKARQRPVRVIPADDRAEMEAGHLIAAGGLFSSNMIARSGADTQEGFGSGPSLGSAAAFNTSSGYEGSPSGYEGGGEEAEAEGSGRPDDGGDTATAADDLT